MTARLVLTVAGQFIGNAILPGAGGIILGGLIGGMIGGAIDGPQKFESARLNDLKATAYEYGSPIPIVYGHPRVAGIVAWASDKIEIESTDSQGKGGPSSETTNFTYKQHCIYLLSDNIISGVSRIWNNGKLIWSLLSNDNVIASGEIINEDPITTGPIEHWDRLTVYTGADDQLPDSVYESIVGVGNVPAHRGKGQVFIEGLNLGSSGFPPALTFEISNGIEIDRSDFLDNFNGDSLILSSHLPDIYPIDFVHWSKFPGTNDCYINGAGKLTTTDNADYDVSCSFSDNILISFPFILESKIDYSGLIHSTDAVFDSQEFARTTFSLDSFRNIQITVYNRTLGGHHEIAGNFTVEVFVNTGSSQFISIIKTLQPPQNIYVKLKVFSDKIEVYLNKFLENTILQDCGMVTLVKSIRIVKQDSFDAPEHILFKTDAVRITTSSVEIISIDSKLSTVVKDICLRSGLEESYLNVSELESDNVDAYVLTQIAPARKAIETLMSAYLFSAVESDKLKFVKRAETVSKVIPYEDTGVSESERFPITINNDIEIPSQVSVTYANILNDYQNGTEYSDRIVGIATGVIAVTMPLGLDPTHAKRIADVQLLDAVVGATRIGPVSLPQSYVEVEPTDVMTIIDREGSHYRARIERITDNAGVRTLDLMLDDASALTSVAQTDLTYISSGNVKKLEDTLLRLIDIPILRDADNEAGFYAAVSPESLDGKWNGAALFKGLADTNYNNVASFSTKTFIGQTVNTLGDYTGIGFDEINTVEVSGVGNLINYSESAILLGSADAYLIGNEVVFAKRAESTSDDSWLLSGLLRGRRGTEWSMDEHVTGDRVVLLTTAMRRVASTTTELGIEYSWRAPTTSKTVSTALLTLFADLGVGLKPFSPVHIEGGRDDDGDLHISWTRRTRLACRYGGPIGTAVPLGENTEAYEVEVVGSGSDPAVLRTLSASAQSVIYTLADQVTDGVGASDPINIVVYQIGALGRGYGQSATI